MVARSYVARRALLCVLLEFAEVVVRRSSIAVVGTKRFIALSLTRAFFLFRLLMRY